LKLSGFADGIMGRILDAMRKHAAFRGRGRERPRSRCKAERTSVSCLLRSQEVQTKTVVISNRLSAKLIGLETEIGLMGHGVSTARHDGSTAEEIAVVGGGDSGDGGTTFLTDESVRNSSSRGASRIEDHARWR
jgi:thioredoxin reductase